MSAWASNAIIQIGMIDRRLILFIRAFAMKLQKAKGISIFILLPAYFVQAQIPQRQSAQCNRRIAASKMLEAKTGCINCWGPTLQQPACRIMCLGKRSNMP
jgi:hypothetical protein